MPAPRASTIRPELEWMRQAAVEASDRIATSAAGIAEQQDRFASLLATLDEGVGDAGANASAYELGMRGLFGEVEWPRLDLVMLGMGDDGHTASLFPGTAALDEERLWVAPNWVEKLGAWRVTLTAPAINAARHVTFLVTGKGKAERLREVLKGERDPSRLPSQLIRPSDGILEWFVDREAAARLELE